MIKKRNTKQKEVIQKELDGIDVFFTSDELHKKVAEHNKHIGIATIYRFLNERKKENKVYSYICDNKSVYSKNKNSHCHFVCEKTGKVIHFTIDSLDFLKNKIPGSIKSFQIEVKGICNTCVPEKKK
jgi:Fe2+ or Zn2+ uptake regulation protein